MNRIIKKLIIYTSPLFIIGSGAHFKLCKNNTCSLSSKISNYQRNFRGDRFSIVAHRGFSSFAVENSKEAITMAANCDLVDFIELDVRLTKDGQLVFSHNNEVMDQFGNNIDIDATHSEKLLNTNLVYSTLPISLNNKDKIINDRSKALNGTYYNIANFIEGVSYCGEKDIFLDLKFENNTKEMSQALIKELKNINTDSIIFQSSDLDALKYLQNLEPNYRYFALIHDKEQLKYATFFDGLGLRKDLVQKELIQDSLNNGRQISIWTLNKIKDIDKVTEELGFLYKDVIYITDCPDVLAYHLQSKERQMKKINAR